MCARYVNRLHGRSGHARYSKYNVEGMIPMSLRIWLALMDVICAVLFIAVSLPLILDKIPPNYLYGVRIPKAFLSDENWYNINQYGGRAVALWSLPLLLTGFLKFFVSPEDLDDPWSVIWLFGPVLTFSAGWVVQTLIHASKL